MLAQNSDDDSDSNYDENDFDEADEEADKKLENLRKAIKNENITATRIVNKNNIQIGKKDDGKPILKKGPEVKGTVTMAKIEQDVANMQVSELIMPQVNNGG